MYSPLTTAAEGGGVGVGGAGVGLGGTGVGVLEGPKTDVQAERLNARIKINWIEILRGIENIVRIIN